MGNDELESHTHQPPTRGLLQHESGVHDGSRR